jgi:sugar lactone lactonase YvrE
MTRALKVLADGLCFTEGPRWHDGTFYFSDMHDDRVCRLTGAGTVETVVEVPNQPSGLGWLPDGRMLVVSMADRRLLRLEADGSLSTVADLWSLAPFHCNDMVVDAAGRAYVGNFGFDLHGSDPRPCQTVLILVEPSGDARVVAEDLGFPNGTVITPDGSTLIVGESMNGCLTAFGIDADGSLRDRRLWAKMDGAVPDGICLDAEGAVWAASPMSNEVIRIAEGGEVLDRVSTGEQQAYACMLGGEDRRTLFVCTSKSSDPDECKAQRSARIEAVEVDVPGAGWP